MKVLQICVAIAALMAVSTASVAFDQQQSAAPAAKPQAGSAGAAATGSQFSADSADSAAQNGTEVRIPGLGKLGVLPKMDFGLELLYGASEPKAEMSQPSATSEDDGDLRIRGTVKHRF
ncbi:MAG: hypothetical protein ACK5KM_09570 [Hyphomicrobiaceae bacterium]